MHKVIPKLIWQTHQSEYKDLSYDYQMATKTWQNLNPSWAYKYTSAKQRARHIKQFDSGILQYYNKCSGVTQADMWKLCILYLYGGVYSDLDSLCTRSLTEMIINSNIKKSFVCIPKIGNNMVMTGSYAAAPKAKICKEIIYDLFIPKIKKYNSGDDKIFIGWENISKEFIKRESEIDFLFNAVNHGGHAGGTYKYSSDFDVYENNRPIKYTEIAKKNNWDF
jgi:hypothetical protein